MADPDTSAEIARLAAGLTYTSETDAPVEPVHWPAAALEGKPLSNDAVLRLAGAAPGARVAAQSVSTFFEPVSEEAEWQNADERAAAQRFKQLAQAIGALKDATVYRIGKNPADVYAVGLTPQGDVAGVKTRVVET